MSDDDWVIYGILIFIFGFILSLAGYMFLALPGLFGIEKQLYFFKQIQFVIDMVQEILRWFILPIYIFTVGAIGSYILYKTEWNSEEEEREIQKEIEENEKEINRLRHRLSVLKARQKLVVKSKGD